MFSLISYKDSNRLTLQTIIGNANKFIYREEKDFADFEDASGNKDYLEQLAKCISNIPLSKQLDLNENDDNDISILLELQKSDIIPSIESNQKSENEETSLKHIVTYRTPKITIPKEPTKVAIESEIKLEDKEKLQGDVTKEPESQPNNIDDLDEDDILDDLLEMPTKPNNKQQSNNNKDSLESEEDLEDWLDSVI